VQLVMIAGGSNAVGGLALTVPPSQYEVERMLVLVVGVVVRLPSLTRSLPAVVS